MSSKSKNAIFICQINEDIFKVAKVYNGQKREFTDLAIEPVEKLNLTFQKLGFNHHPITICLSSKYATSRCLKIPTHSREEIERIVSLQAPRYLPFPANELITGYQILSTDKEGNTHINLTIVHKDIIERQFKFFSALKPAKIKIFLSPYGLANLYNFLNLQDSGSVMVIDIDSQQAEFAVISRKKFLFSHYFKLDRNQPNWENALIFEINKTHDAYLKEAIAEPAGKIVILDAGNIGQGFTETLKKQATLPVEILSYPQKIKVLENISFTALFGLGLADLEESLNLMPLAIKEEAKNLTYSKERNSIILLVCGIIFILSVSLAKSLTNKSTYLERLKAELNKISPQAQSLEEIEKRFQLLETRIQKKPSSVDVLYELHQISPNSVHLVNLIYEEDEQLILRGSTQELSSVFQFATQLEKSVVFKNFNVKVRYATKKQTQKGEIVDFEITCHQKK